VEGPDGLRPHLSPTPPASPTVEFHGDPSAGRALLLLPGYGDTAAVFSRRLHLIDPDHRWTVAIAEPATQGPDGPLWYTVGDDGPDAAGLSQAVDGIEAALDTTSVRAGVARDQIVLVGYSQGGAAALATLLDPTTGDPPLAVGVLAGYLAHRDADHLDLTRAAHRPVLVAHGTDDTMVETLRGRSAARVLHRHDASVTWSEAPGGHRLGRHLLAPLADWLATLADGDRPAPSAP
jgi:predicted esterase